MVQGGGLAFKANYSRFSIFSSGGHFVHRSRTISKFSSGGHLVYRSGTILAILVGSRLGNIPMKFESHWPNGSGGYSF